MRTIKFEGVIAVAAILFAATQATASMVETHYIDFTGWDSSLIDDGPGQTFTDVYPALPGPPVDVFVKAIGDFTVPSDFAFGTIRDALMQIDETHVFEFTFNRSVGIVIETNNVDSQEFVGIRGEGPETYMHESGAAPIITPTTDGLGIDISGTGVTLDPVTGAAKGTTTTMAATGTAISVTHTSLGFDNKWELFRVGITVVPEPNSMGLCGFGTLGLLLFRRQR